MLRCPVLGGTIKAEVVVVVVVVVVLCLLVALYRANNKFLFQIHENIYRNRTKVNRFISEALTLHVCLQWFEIM